MRVKVPLVATAIDEVVAVGRILGSGVAVVKQA